METSTNQRKGQAAILISDRGDFRARKLIRNKEEHYIMIKTKIKDIKIQEDIKIFNMYVPNNRALKYMR